jgi:hypothetical protein
LSKRNILADVFINVFITHDVYDGKGSAIPHSLEWEGFMHAVCDVHNPNLMED